MNLETPHTIALTGATGFLGKQLLTALLEAGYPEVRCLYHHVKPELRDSRVQWVEGDLRDPFSLEDLLEGTDTLIHTASLVSYRLLDKARLFEINAHGTGHLVNAALHRGVRHFLHISSTAALGMAPVSGDRDESSEWSKHRGNTPCAESKYQAELEVWRGREEGLAVTVLQPALLLDPLGQQKYTRLLLDWAARERKFYPPGRIGLVDLRDVVRFTLERIKTGPSGERIILAAENWSYHGLLTELASKMELSGPSRVLPLPVARMVSIWNKWATGLGLHPQEVMLAYANMAVNATRSQEQYGFAYTPLADTLREMVSAYRKK